MSFSLFIACITSFLVTFFATPYFIKFLREISLVGIDVQKKEKPKIPEMGGPVVLAGFVSGIFLFIWIKVFLYGETQKLVEVFAGICTILLISLIGIFDDLSARARKGLKRKGLKQWQKPLFTLPAAIPLVAIMTGNTMINIPLIGPMDIGILYPLLLVPLGVVGASNAINMLAGMNGLETGLGFILLSSLGIYAYIHGNIYIAAIALTFTFALLAFLRYNWYPAKIFPGDSLVYTIGATVAVVAIIGNMERFALYCFTLWFIEFLLKARSRFKAESFGILQEDGTLKAPYKQVYSLTHLVMKLGKFNEKQIVSIILTMQLIVSLVAFFICLKL
jgi:UDP-N-acetylglucosamine--dolichyl-phosphate N-acetylglucosaminephosphotransferase